MKSDGTDQMNTVAKTAEYPFERLAFPRDAASLRRADVFLFISNLVWICPTVLVCAVLAHRYACSAQGAGPLRQGTLQHLRCVHLNFWDGRLHKFSRL